MDYYRTEIKVFYFIGVSELFSQHTFDILISLPNSRFSKILYISFIWFVVETEKTKNTHHWSCYFAIHIGHLALCVPRTIQSWSYPQIREDSMSFLLSRQSSASSQEKQLLTLCTNMTQRRSRKSSTVWINLTSLSFKQMYRHQVNTFTKQFTVSPLDVVTSHRKYGAFCSIF